MNNEIKEILDNLKKTADNIIFVICGSQEELDKAPKYTANFLSINDRQAKTLLDYITNLQEKVNQYENPDDMTLMFMWCNEKAKDKIKELQEDLDYQKEMYLEYCDKHTKLIQKYNNLQEENKRLKEDIRKDEVYFKTFELAEECDQKQDIIDDYKSRIDKATKILNKGLKELDTRSRSEVYIEEYLENALDELQGSDK